jgi:hypothetical protein
MDNDTDKDYAALDMTQRTQQCYANNDAADVDTYNYTTTQTKTQMPEYNADNQKGCIGQTTMQTRMTQL